MRIWVEIYDSSRRFNPMGAAVGEAQGVAQHHRAPTLDPRRVIFVKAAGFTFEFHSVEQLPVTHSTRGDIMKNPDGYDLAVTHT